MLFVAALAALLLIGGMGAAIAALLIGVAAASFKQTKFIAPIFLLILPLAALGALAGCLGLGGYLIRHVNENLVLWGPAAGLFVGACAGGLLGLALSAGIWWRAFRRIRSGVRTLDMPSE